MAKQKVTFSIPDMHCDSCPKLIKLTLEDMPGVTSATASLQTKTAEVEFDDSKITVPQFIEAIKEAGYTASQL